MRKNIIISERMQEIVNTNMSSTGLSVQPRIYI